MHFVKYYFLIQHLIDRKRLVVHLYNIGVVGELKRDCL
jgi:hypothetical protein